jgi:hypothetical protein
MGTKLNQYVYSPLPARHIRLLYLNTPITPDQESTWSLRVVPIPGKNSQTPVSFDALSYTWGSLSTSHFLEVDGRELQIHYNLYSALPYLSRRPSTLPLWIDAVCINQADEVEKLAQIRLMADIYRSATTVWVWLGLAKGAGTTEALKDVLPRMNEISTILMAVPGEETILPSEVNLPELDSPVWDALDGILNNPWFLRLWIVQEAALGRNISCLLGSHVIDWKVLEEAVTCAPQLRHLQDTHGRKPRVIEGNLTSNMGVFYCRNMYQDWIQDEIHKPYSLQELVMGICSQVLHHKCSNPRDRVLAMFGFIGSDHEIDIKVDENTLLPDLYAEFMHFVLQGTGGVIWWYLFKVAIDDDKSEGIPSWCPDLHYARTFWKVPQPLATQGPYEASSKDISSRKGARSSEMVLKGTKIDKVKNLGPMFEDADLGGYTGRYFVAWLSKVIEWESSASELVFGSSNMRDHDRSAWDKSRTTGFTEEEYWMSLIGNSSGYGKARSLDFNDFVSFKSALDEFRTITQNLGRERQVSRIATTQTIKLTWIERWNVARIKNLEKFL